MEPAPNPNRKLGKDILRLLRPHHWTKNLFCFAGVFFAQEAGGLYPLGRAILTFLAFCCVSSAIYVINDILDRKRDLSHPVKRHRPIASGAIQPSVAVFIALIGLGLGVSFGGMVGPSVVLILAMYSVLNLGYSMGLKDIVVLDVLLISAGFILRIFAGTAAIDASPTGWLLLCTFFLAIFLGFGKRRAELRASQDQSMVSRKVLGDYSVVMLDRFCSISATLAISAYALYTMLSPHYDKSLLVTVPPVTYGLFRYIYLVEKRELGETPEEILLKDRHLQLTVLIWMVFCIAVLYWGVSFPIGD